MFSHLTDVHAANRPLLAALVMILDASLISAILSMRRPFGGRAS